MEITPGNGVLGSNDGEMSVSEMRAFVRGGMRLYLCRCGFMLFAAICFVTTKRRGFRLCATWPRGQYIF